MTMLSILNIFATTALLWPVDNTATAVFHTLRLLGIPIFLLQRMVLHQSSAMLSLHFLLSFIDNSTAVVPTCPVQASNTRWALAIRLRMDATIIHLGRCQPPVIIGLSHGVLFAVYDVARFYRTNTMAELSLLMVFTDVFEIVL